MAISFLAHFDTAGTDDYPSTDATGKSISWVGSNAICSTYYGAFSSNSSAFVGGCQADGSQKSYVQSPANSAFNIGAGDFTISFWYSPFDLSPSFLNDPTQRTQILGTVGLSVEYDPVTDQLVIVIGQGGGVAEAAWGESLSTAYTPRFYQATRSGNTLYLGWGDTSNQGWNYDSGLDLGPTGWNVTAVGNSTQPLRIGYGWAKFYIDEVYVNNGGAIYTVTAGDGSAPIQTAPYTISGGGSAVIDPTVGHPLLNGYTPTISRSIILTPSIGHETATGYAPTIDAVINVSPAIGHEVSTGYAPTVVSEKNVSPTIGSASYTGYAPIIELIEAGTTVLYPSIGTLTATGYAPTLSLSDNHLVVPDAGSELATGHAPTITQAKYITPSQGAISADGYAPQLRFNTAIAPQVGHVVAGGHAPTINLVINRVINALPGSALFSGGTPDVLLGNNRYVFPSHGQSVFSGKVPYLKFGSELHSLADSIVVRTSINQTTVWTEQ